MRTFPIQTEILESALFYASLHIASHERLLSLFHVIRILRHSYFLVTVNDHGCSFSLQIDISHSYYILYRSKDSTNTNGTARAHIQKVVFSSYFNFEPQAPPHPTPCVVDYRVNLGVIICMLSTFCTCLYIFFERYTFSGL